jgi:hypothetical protein
MTAIESQAEMDGVLRELSPEQLRWVVARLECNTNKEACRRARVAEATLYRWGDVVHRAVDVLARDGVRTALELRRRALAKAMLVKVDGLDSRDQRVRQQAATEIIEWEMGKAAATVDLRSEGKGLSALLADLRRTLTAEDDDGEDA